MNNWDVCCPAGSHHTLGNVEKEIGFDCQQVRAGCDFYTSHLISGLINSRPAPSTHEFVKPDLWRELLKNHILLVNF